MDFGDLGKMQRDDAAGAADAGPDGEKTGGDDC